MSSLAAFVWAPGYAERLLCRSVGAGPGRRIYPWMGKAIGWRRGTRGERGKEREIKGPLPLAAVLPK